MTMYKIVGAILSAVVSAGAMAEWGNVGSNDVGTAYVDRSTIRRNGGVVKMWTLIDYASAKNESGRSSNYLSTKALYEYDCDGENVRTIYSLNHSGHMGNGEPLNKYDQATKWEPVPPGSFSQIQLKIACGKK